MSKPDPRCDEACMFICSGEAKQALAAANERIRELELLLAAQKQEWSKAYDIGVTCKHHLAAEREVSNKLEKALNAIRAKAELVQRNHVGHEGRMADRLDQRVRALDQLGENMTFEEWADQYELDLDTRATCQSAWAEAALAEREACAKICDAKANALGERADLCDDDEDAIELKARAWQMAVLAAELRERSNA